MIFYEHGVGQDDEGDKARGRAGSCPLEARPDSSIPTGRHFAILPGRKWRLALLAGSSALALGLAAGPVLAQAVYIENGEHEIVDGSDPDPDGSGPGTQPSPWNEAVDLIVGRSGDGTLAIQNGGEVPSTENGYIGLGSEGTVLVSGAGSAWANSNFLDVGNNGKGELTIENDGLVSSWGTMLGWYGTGEIFLNSGGVLETGYVWRGTGSGTLAFDGGIMRASRDETDFLQNFDAGDVTIGAGGAIFDTNGFDIGIATDLRGDGDLTKVGAGVLTLTGDSSYDGDTVVDEGTLRIEDGGQVSSGTGFIGLNPDSSGTVIVSGSGSTWTSSDALVIGYQGTGGLTIKDGGFVSSSWTALGGLSGDGTLILDSAGVLETGYVEKGSGTGTLTFDGGILRATDDETDFLRNFGAGDVTIGADGAIIDSNGFDIGIATDLQGTGGLIKRGDGTLRLTGDSSAISGDVTLSAGALAIDGGRLGDGGSALRVGHNDGDDGSLDIANGGAVSVRSGYLGDEADGSGAVTVSGVDGDASQLSATFLYVGYGGTGTLAVTEGGRVSSTIASVGENAGSVGTVTVSGQGSSWGSSLSTLNVGVNGEGRIDISDGGRVSIADATIGYHAGGVGEATVSGADDDGNASTWANREEMTVGFEGKGTLTVSQGGQVTSGGGFIGARDGGEGEVRVTGAGSVWNTNASSNDLYNGLHVGSYGTGRLVIEDGALVENARAFIGSEGGTGTVVVRGTDDDGRGASWISSHTLNIGDNSVGVLTIANGGTVTANDGQIGVEGATCIGLFCFGGQGRGALNIGAAVDDDPAAPGKLVISGTNALEFGNGEGTVVFNHTDADYEFSTALISGGRGTHAIQHNAGTTILTGDSTDFSGTTTVSGGTLLVNSTLGGTFTVDSGGTLGGTGTVGSGAGSTVTVADGGILAPGNSIGTLTVDGNLMLSSGAILDFEFGGPGTGLDPAGGRSDRIAVSGDLALNGTLNLAQSGDPGDGDPGLGYYRLMTYAGDLTDSGLEFGDRSAFGSADLDILAGGGVVDLFVSPDGEDDLQHWQGGDGVWNATNAQWLNRDGTISAAWAGNHAVFRHEPGAFAGGLVEVEGAHAFRGLQFVDEGYRLEGSGSLVIDADGSEIRVLADMAGIATQITGTGGITKTEAGTLILSGNNSYEGGTRLNAGVLSVSSDTNLGHADGDLTFNGGVLQITGTDMTGTGRGIVWGTHGGGFDIADAGHSFTLGHSLVGDGDLIKRGDGTLALSGANAYGDTRVEAGTLVGSAASISGDIANAGTVVFDQTSNAAFAGDMAGLNGTAGDMILRGGAMLTLGGSSALDWTIEDGTLETAAAHFAGDVLLDGTNTSLVFNDAADARYGGVLSGNGTFTLDSSGSVLLTGDSSGFAGTTSVSGGRLVVGDGNGNGALGGSLAIADGGMLGGAGTIGSGAGSTVTIADRGTLSPGNSIGTLTVDGDLVFSSGSRFEVEVSPGGTDSDLVEVTGTATLNGGTVAHIGATGTYDLRSTYTILSAGTLAGAFDDVTSDFAFLTPGLTHDYGSGTVDLELVRNERDFASAALTRNQTATAEGIESIGIDAGHAVYDAIAQLADDDDLIRGSFDALSGEIHASARSALIEDSRFVRNAANDRVRAAFGGTGVAVAPAFAYGPDDAPMPVAADHAGPVFWSHGFGAWGSTDGDGNAGGIDRNTGGVLLGADALVTDRVRLGLLAGYSRSSLDLGGRASSADVGSYHLGLYGGTQWAMAEGTLSLRGGLSYSWHDIETGRSIGFSGFSDSLSADYSANTFQAFGELGYGIETDVARLEPFVNLAHLHTRTGSFSESGGAAALSGTSGSTGVTFATPGIRAETDIDLGEASGRLSGMIGWRHAAGDVTPEATHAFAGSDAFTIAGSPIGRNAQVFETGFDVDISSSATLGVSYQGQIASGAQDHGFRVNLGIRF